MGKQRLSQIGFFLVFFHPNHGPLVKASHTCIHPLTNIHHVPTHVPNIPSMFKSMLCVYMVLGIPPPPPPFFFKKNFNTPLHLKKYFFYFL